MLYCLVCIPHGCHASMPCHMCTMWLMLLLLLLLVLLPLPIYLSVCLVYLARRHIPSHVWSVTCLLHPCATLHDYSPASCGPTQLWNHPVMEPHGCGTTTRLWNPHPVVEPPPFCGTTTLLWNHHLAVEPPPGCGTTTRRSPLVCGAGSLHDAQRTVVAGLVA